MIRPLLPALALTAAIVGACTAAQPASPISPPISARMMSAGAYVEYIYANPPAWGTDEEVRALFAPDLAEAIVKDRGAPDEVGVLNFDFRCGCQDGDITAVRATHQDTPEGAQVTANFLWEKKPVRIDYTLLRTARGWLIADARSTAQLGNDAWSLRGLLKLPRLSD